jgi:hypothetical protein
MKAILKEIYSIQVNEYLDKFHPDDPYNFCILVSLSIGPMDKNSSNDFSLTVCTPEWLKGACTSGKYEWGRHMLFVHEYDFPLIKKVITEYIDECEGDDWMVIANRISRIAAWEFEDYNRYK